MPGSSLQAVKRVLKHTPAYRLYQRHVFQKWVRAGRPVPPPPFVKRQIVCALAQKYKRPVFVETGTFMGDMVDAIRSVCATVYSIELSAELAHQAQARFSAYAHIHILQGDSATVLQDLLTGIQQPCLFWLDGHYSAGITAKGLHETPIRAELECIRKHPLAHQHLILIDDARCFTGRGDYPTLESLREWAATAGYRHFAVEDDIIRLYPNG